jgi:diacylglycerol kinase (ATP)
MYYYIVNPAAGHGAAHTIQDKLRTELKSLGIGGEFVTTTGQGDATRLASQAIAKGYTTIVAVGGDETINEIINGVTGDTAAIGVIPIGSTNKIASQLGIKTWEQGCAVLAARRITEYALIAAGDDYFLSSLTLGFETELPDVQTPPNKNLKDKMLHLRDSFKKAQNYKTISCKIQVDDGYTVRAEVFSLNVTNQKFINPLAPNELSVMITDRPSKRQIGSLLLQRNKSESLNELATTNFQGKKIKLATEPPINVAIDGKIIARTPLTIRLTDRRVRFIVEKPSI